MKKYKKASDKWWDIAQGKAKDCGGDNCILCQQHAADCLPCPVAKDSGAIQCLKTPHYQWRCYWVDKRKLDWYGQTADNDESQRLALNFWLYLVIIGQ